MKRIAMMVLVLMVSGCGSLSMAPDYGTKLEKSPCACKYEVINGRS